MAGRSISDRLPRLAAAAVLALALGAVPALPGDRADCAALDHLIAQASDEGGPPRDAPEAALADPTCSTVLTTDTGRALVCHWAYPYRSDTAQHAFDAMNDRVRTCLRADPLPPEPGVNHPDSYHQTRYRTDTLALSVSLKDKAALQKSFVFLRISGL